VSTHLYSYRMRFAEERVNFFENDLRDHRIAMACVDLECALNDLNILLAELLLLDSQLQDEYFDGKEYDEALSDRFANLFSRWLSVAEKLIDQADGFENRQHTVLSAEALRLAIREVKSGLAPSGSASDAIIELRDRAIEEHRRGETVPMLATL